MTHRVLHQPYRPFPSTAVFRVTASRAKDVVLADGNAPVGEAPASSGSAAPTVAVRPRRRRRRLSGADR
jgi:hypothetical protein